VLSPAAYNSKTGTMLCCPMTTQIKGYPFEVIIRVAAARFCPTT
jgi:mRNA interferase MazF